MYNLWIQNDSMLKETFIALLNRYDNSVLQEELWSEVETKYSAKKRYYHTLQHLDNLLIQLALVRNEIQNWDAILFSMFYHDIIYSPLRSDNEEKSAVLAEQRMKQISVGPETIELCKVQILSTRSHLFSPDNDTNYFTDADLSVLGADRAQYIRYCTQIRKEYSMYPDLVYKPGRKKVLAHFLGMPRIYKTHFFYNKLEEQARQNLQWELHSLN
jgi:predicted metal-dependent HD superfamily phosphohydrolase